MSRIWGLTTSHNSIRWETSYILLTHRRFLLVSSLCTNWFLQTQKHLTVRSLITNESTYWTHYQVNFQLSYWHNYEGEEEGKVGQDKYWGGVFRNITGWRYEEDQVGRKQKDEKGSSEVCPGTKMIT